jgi:hypothetical protein
MLSIISRPYLKMGEMSTDIALHAVSGDTATVSFVRHDIADRYAIRLKDYYCDAPPPRQHEFPPPDVSEVIPVPIEMATKSFLASEVHARCLAIFLISSVRSFPRPLSSAASHWQVSFF